MAIHYCDYINGNDTTGTGAGARTSAALRL